MRWASTKGAIALKMIGLPRGSVCAFHALQDLLIPRLLSSQLANSARL